MKIESRDKRELVFSMFLSLLPNFIIAVAVSFFADSDKGVAFMMVFFGLYALEIAIWFKNFVWSWAYFLWRGKKKGTQAILTYLKTNKYPEPEDIIVSAEQYFSDVARNSDLSDELRIQAAVTMGAASYPMAQFQLSNGFQVALMQEDALEKYKETFKQ